MSPTYPAASTTSAPSTARSNPASCTPTTATGTSTAPGIPLMSILFPERLAEILQAWVNAYKEGGWLPQFPSPGYRACMTGSLIDAVFGDAAAKRLPGFDLATAYAGLREARHHTRQPRQGLRSPGHRAIPQAQLRPRRPDRAVRRRNRRRSLRRLQHCAGRPRSRQRNRRALFRAALHQLEAPLRQADPLPPRQERRWFMAHAL